MFSHLHLRNVYLGTSTGTILFAKINLNCLNICYVFNKKINIFFTAYSAFNSDAPLPDSTKVIKEIKG